MKSRTVQTQYRLVFRGLGTILSVIMLMAVLAMLTACKPGRGNTVKTIRPDLPATGSQGVIPGGPQVLQPDCGLSTCVSAAGEAQESQAAQTEPVEEDQPDCQSLPYGSSQAILSVQCRDTSQ